MPIYFAAVPSVKTVYFLSKLITLAPRQTSIRVRFSSSMPSKSGHSLKIFRYFFKLFSFLLKIQHKFRFYYTIIVSENQAGETKMIRKIIKIDKNKCNGCGACATACHEGAIAMVNGKAELLREDFCDGLGDCLPACPTGAITFELREAKAYDEAAVKKAQKPLPSCRGARPKAIRRSDGNEAASRLRQWPCQIKLIPTDAPYLDGSHLLIAADCTAFAYGSFHDDFIRGRITLIGCPKLDGCDYAEKLTAIISSNDIKSVKVVRMDVPCCSGIEAAAKKALRASGKILPFEVVTITTDGKILY
jgi:ferredoxin